MADHYSQLYRELRSIDPRDFQRIIRTYEEKEQEIGRLDIVEHFELNVSYVEALFETGAYRKHQLMVDPVIAACIQHDLRTAPGVEQDLFEYLLFRKAISAYRLQDLKTTEHVLRELIKMQPREELYVRFLRTALFRRKQSVLQFGRAAFILCTLLTAAVITLNLLVVRHFYASYARTVGLVAMDVFLLGLLILAAVYGYAFYKARREALGFRRAQENKRRR